VNARIRLIAVLGMVVLTAPAAGQVGGGYWPPTADPSPWAPNRPPAYPQRAAEELAPVELEAKPLPFAYQGQAGYAKRYDLPQPGSRPNKVRESLELSCDVAFVDTPLHEVVDFYRDKFEIPIQIDHRALEDVGLDKDAPLTLIARKIRVRAALDYMLKELDLTWYIREGVMMITTPEESQFVLETRLYAVSDLVSATDRLTGETMPPDFDTLADLITSTIAPTTWANVGGPSPIDCYSLSGQDFLVISQTDSVHQEIVRFLEVIRSARQRPAPARGRTLLELGIKPPTGSGRVDLLDEDEERLVKALETRVSLAVQDVPLSDCCRTLSDAAGIPILIDRRALDDVGIASDTPVTLDLCDTELKTLLRVMLRPLDLTTVQRNGYLLITTPEEAQCKLSTRFYNVLDLVLLRQNASQNVITADFDSLLDLIQATVAPTTWAQVGGPGCIDVFDAPCHVLLVVSQTDEVHGEVEQLLTKLHARVEPMEPLPIQPVGANPMMGVPTHGLPYGAGSMDRF
jgi:hypothetical protein